MAFVDTSGTGTIDPAIMDASTLGQDLNTGLINQDFNALNQQAFDPSQAGLDNSLQSLMNTTLSDPNLQGFGGNASGAAPSWNPQLAGAQAGQQGGLSTDGTNQQQADGTQQNRNVNPQGTSPQSFYQQLRDALSGVGRQMGSLGFSTPANAAELPSAASNEPTYDTDAAGNLIRPQTRPLSSLPGVTQSNFQQRWGDWQPGSLPTSAGRLYGTEPTTSGFPATSGSGTTRSITPAPTVQPGVVPAPQPRPATADGTADLPQSGVLTPDTGTAPDSTSTAPKRVQTVPYTGPGTAPPPGAETPPSRTGTDNTGNPSTAPGPRSAPSLQQLAGMLQRMGLPPWLANVIAQAVGQRTGMQGGRMPGGMPFRGMPGRMPFPMMRGRGFPMMRGRGGRGGFRGFPGGFPGRGMPPWMRGGRGLVPSGFPGGGFPGGGFPGGQPEDDTGQDEQDGQDGQQGTPGSWAGWEPGTSTQPGTPDFSQSGAAPRGPPGTFRPGQAGAAPGGIDYNRNVGPPQNDYLPGGERSNESPMSAVPMGAPGTPDYTLQPGMRLGPQGPAQGPRPDAVSAAAGHSRDIPAQVLAGARQAALSGGPGGVAQFMAQNGYPQWGNWCGEFAAAVMHSQGIPVPRNPAIASNWRNWGNATTRPGPGDVAVRRGVPTGATGSHVTTVESINGDGTFTAIGGNQGAMRRRMPMNAYDFRTMRPQMSPVTQYIQQNPAHAY